MKKEDKTELTRKKIISAAMKEFGSKGYAGAALNNICATGIPKGLLYHNFKNKDAVYLACAKQCISALTERLRSADIGCNLQKYMSIRMKYFEEHECEAQVFFDAILQPPEHLCAQIKELRTEFDELNMRLYRQMLSSVTLRKDVSFEDALSYFSMMQSMFNCWFSSSVSLEIPFKDKINTHEANLTKLLDLMFYGIAERR